LDIYCGNKNKRLIREQEKKKKKKERGLG